MAVTAANVHDSVLVEALLDDLPAIRTPRGSGARGPPGLYGQGVRPSALPALPGRAADRQPDRPAWDPVVESAGALPLEGGAVAGLVGLLSAAGRAVRRARPPAVQARSWPGRSSRLALLGPGHAVGGELLQQRRELSLDLDHPAGLVELGCKPLVLLAQPGDLQVAGIGRLAPRRGGQRLQRTTVALLAPLGDQRRVQALAPQQRTLAVLSSRSYSARIRAL
jgi:hypothetical protein